MGMPPMTPPPGIPAPGGAPNQGGGVLPAPPQPPSAGAMDVLSDVNSIITATRNIAQQFPATVQIADQIRSLVQQMQMKIIQSLPPTEVAAPPV